jgi:RNA polymerase sigma-70 factor, ECF subfamily
MEIIMKNQGNNVGFETFAMEFLDLIYTAALRIVSNTKKAEDLVQGTFLRAFDNYSQIDDNTDSKVWMFGMLADSLLNESMPQNHRCYTGFEQQSSWLADEDSFPPGPEAFHSFSYQELFNDSNSQMFFLLSEEQRLMILLADIEQLELTDIAKVLRKPVESVKNCLPKLRMAVRSGELTENKQAALR